MELAECEGELWRSDSVDVFGPKGSETIMALMDEGSTVTLLDSSVANRIGLNGDKMELVLQDCWWWKYSEKKTRKARQLGVNSVKRNKKGKTRPTVASRTALGWVLHGIDTSITRQVNIVNTCLNINEIDADMHNLIKVHFSIESLGVEARRPSNDAEWKALAILNKTCKRLQDGRFEVGLLWKTDDISLPESYALAENRLKSMERKFDKDTKLKVEYSKQIQHLLQNNYAEEAPQTINSHKIWYLPHFAVVHPLKNKIRIVFDAAAKSRGKSLNDALLSGPDLLQSLFGVLIRFRQGPDSSSR
ncbi:unnamed protein product [Colias eurytheme]|nr:unnamed protein product [Colias eurytheme]